MANNNTKQKGVWIPIELFENENLTLVDKTLYSIVKYYTDNGKGCYYSANKLANLFNVSEKTIDRSRKKLKGLGMLMSKKDKDMTVYFTHVPASVPANVPANNGDNENFKSGYDREGVPASVPAVDDDENLKVRRDNLSISEGHGDPANSISEGHGDPAINKEHLNKELNKEKVYKSTVNIGTVTGETGMEIFKSSLYRLTLSNGDFSQFPKGGFEWLDTLCVKYALMRDKTDLDLEYLQYEINNGDVTQVERERLYHQIETALPF